jgi:hypothetical protein
VFVGPNKNHRTPLRCLVREYHRRRQQMDFQTFLPHLVTRKITHISTSDKSIMNAISVNGNETFWSAATTEIPPLLRSEAPRAAPDIASFLPWLPNRRGILKTSPDPLLPLLLTSSDPSKQSFTPTNASAKSDKNGRHLEMCGDRSISYRHSLSKKI